MAHVDREAQSKWGATRMLILVSSDSIGLPHISQLYALVSLAKLRDDGIISSEEFDAKKAELLSRL
jgi:Short C-terminal domain